MWQRLLKWERKRWLDGGMGDDEGVGISEGFADIGLDLSEPSPADITAAMGLAEAQTAEAVGAVSGETAGEAGVGFGAGAPGIKTLSPGEEVEKKEKLEQEKKEEKKEERRRRRPTLLTQQGGLLGGSGIRKSLIGG